MNIDLLQGSLPVSENPGLDSTDPRFDEIATLVMAGKELEAANLSATIIGEGAYDIRLICYLVYGYWLEQGLASLLDVINSLNNVISENWEAVGPVNKREKNFQNSLGWMFRQLLKKLQYEESKNSPLWQQWQSTVTADELEDILEAGEIFQRTISQQLADDAGSVLDLWSKITQWLKALQRLVYRPPEPEPVEAKETAVDATETSNTVATGSKTGGLEIEVSYQMNLLLEKLAAFEQLLEQEKFPRAALVADDINLIVANFDPKLYFPKAFKTFARLNALNFAELSVYSEQRDAPEWQAMQEWYKVDLDSFINS